MTHPWNSRNNLQAEAYADQMRAHIRDDEDLPDDPMLCAAAARTIRLDSLPPELRATAGPILDEWADEYGVERPETQGEA